MNLLVLGFAIILVVVAQRNITNGSDKSDLSDFKDRFTPGNVPMVPIGGAPYNPQQIAPGTQPYGQPMMYPQQYYPAKTPWATETGRPCEGGCGAVGVCKDGFCTVKDQYNTVFDIPIN